MPSRFDVRSAFRVVARRARTARARPIGVQRLPVRAAVVAACLTAFLAVTVGMPADADAQASGGSRRQSSGSPGASATSVARHISFSGYDWLVKNSADARLGPGPNYFSDSARNVWVDELGRLHLRIEKRNGRWYSAEVISTASFGYGTYRWYLDSPVDRLDPNVVLGLFTWNDDPAYNHRELDIEFARWGNASYANGQYTVQPYTVAGNQFIFNEPPGVPQTTHSLVWGSASAAFKSIRGHASTSSDPSLRIAEHSFSQGVPPTGGENARMNLWLFEGSAPADRKDVEIVIKRFEFIPPSIP
jgi:hypothetical protein